ncbi:hypothetical protein MVEN_02548900 [Mycena venus]|uniref:Uncharacterized protein n=1 Tax=Mycena venus TaxID=2733690 RepID=A0A8H6U2E5_9AGAR|nr:hypothetical protein MVEN_02548900 [Mycena venus]
MKCTHKVLGRGSKSPSATGSPRSVRAPLAPPSTTLSHSPAADEWDGHRPQTLNYYMNVAGGVGGPGGRSEWGAGGNGGFGQGPTLNYNVRTTHFTVHENNLSDALEKLGLSSGGEFTRTVNSVQNITHKSSEFNDFREIRLGDLDLREEKQSGRAVGSVSRKRRVYAARVHGCKRPMTVAVYEGADIEKQWLEEIKKYEGLRLPTLVQVFASGVVKSKQLYATIYEDDLIPIAQFRQWYWDSEIASHLLEYYVDMELDRCEDYLEETTGSYANGQTLWIRGSTQRLCLELSKSSDGTKSLSSGGYTLHPPERLSGKAQEAIWMSSFKLEDFHDVMVRYAGIYVWPQISPHHLCRPGAILFLPDLDADPYQNYNEIGVIPGGEVAHIPGLQFHDSGWISSSRNVESICTEMGNGWIRFWFPRIPAPCEEFVGRTISVSDSHEGKWPIKAAWLSQAHHIFSRYGIKDDPDSYAFIAETTYSVSLLDSGRPPAENTLLSGLYLFLSPVGAMQNCPPWGLAYPVPAFWSLEPSGSHYILPEDAAVLGLPTIAVSAELWGNSWSSKIYRGLVEFHRCKGFNPDSPDVALYRGLPLYQPSLHDGVYPYVELV